MAGRTKRGPKGYKMRAAGPTAYCAMWRAPSASVSLRIPRGRGNDLGYGKNRPADVAIRSQVPNP